MNLRRAILLLLIVTGILLRVRVFTGLDRDNAVCTTDFAAFYAGGQLAGSLEMYSPAAVFQVEQKAMGCHMENLIFIKPPFYGLMMWPLAQLPFEPALWLWRALGLAAIGVFLWLWPGDRLAAAAGCAWFLPLAASFTVGQDVALVLALAAGAYWCWRTGRLFVAGILLGLCAIKFHLFLLLPILIIYRKLWRTAAGGACVLLALTGISTFVYGPGWVARYLGALQDSRMNPYPRNMVNLNGLFHYHTLWIAAAVVVAALCWFLIARSSLTLSLAVVLAGGVLIAPHNTICDGVLFLPLLLLACREEWVGMRVLGIFVLTPLYAFLPVGTLQVAMVALLVLFAVAEIKRPGRDAGRAMELTKLQKP